jgi:hypothetical protein
MERIYRQRAINVCIFGASFNTNNMGVSALAASLVKNIVGVHPDANISFLIGNKCGGKQEIKIKEKIIEINIVNYRLSPKAHIQEHLFCILFLAILWRILPFSNVRNKIICSNKIYSWFNSVHHYITIKKRINTISSNLWSVSDIYRKKNCTFHTEASFTYLFS